MSDLQCPATVLVVGRRGWVEAGIGWDGVNLAGVYAVPPAHPSALAAAVQLGLPLLDVPALAVATDGGMPHLACEEIADRHRGESVLLLADIGGGDEEAPVRREVRIDADGWQVTPLR